MQEEKETRFKNMSARVITTLFCVDMEIEIGAGRSPFRSGCAQLSGGEVDLGGVVDRGYGNARVGERGGDSGEWGRLSRGWGGGARGSAEWWREGGR